MKEKLTIKITKLNNLINKQEEFEDKDKEISSKEVDRDQLLKNLRNNNASSIYNWENSPKAKNKTKYFKKSLEGDVLDWLKSPGSPSKTTSMIWETLFQKSMDFGALMMTENDSIFTIAGYSDKPIETIENYKSDIESWNLIQWPLKDPRTKFAAVSYLHINSDGSKSEKILIMGGKMGNGKRTDLIQEYDPKTNLLKEFARLPKPISGFASVSTGNKIYIIGGNDGKIRSQVNWLDIETMEWSTLSPLNIKKRWIICSSWTWWMNLRSWWIWWKR